MIFRNIAFFFAMSSFLSVVAVSVDRFLAVHLHLRYQEVVTHKRIFAVAISIWLLSATVPLLTLLNLLDAQRLILSLFGIAGILLTTLIYIRIYFVVRRHKMQIQSLRVLQSEERANFSSLISSAVGVFYIYVFIIVCYVPFLISLEALGPNNSSTSIKIFFLFSLTLLYLNSSLNPVIYCWKMRHIRRTIMDLLRNTPWTKHRVSQQHQQMLFSPS